MLPVSGYEGKSMVVATQPKSSGDFKNIHVVSWPVNEILLEYFTTYGKTDHQIAELFGVKVEDVVRLRTEYNLST